MNYQKHFVYFSVFFSSVNDMVVIIITLVSFLVMNK